MGHILQKKNHVQWLLLWNKISVVCTSTFVISGSSQDVISSMEESHFFPSYFCIEMEVVFTAFLYYVCNQESTSCYYCNWYFVSTHTNKVLYTDTKIINVKIFNIIKEKCYIGGVSVVTNLCSLNLSLHLNTISQNKVISILKI